MGFHDERVYMSFFSGSDRGIGTWHDGYERVLNGGKTVVKRVLISNVALRGKFRAMTARTNVRGGVALLDRLNDAATLGTVIHGFF